MTLSAKKSAKHFQQFSSLKTFGNKNTAENRQKIHIKNAIKTTLKHS
jgi:hypothetical protein